MQGCSWVPSGIPVQLACRCQMKALLWWRLSRAHIHRCIASSCGSITDLAMAHRSNGRASAAGSSSLRTSSDIAPKGSDDNFRSRIMVRPQHVTRTLSRYMFWAGDSRDVLCTEHKGKQSPQIIQDLMSDAKNQADNCRDFCIIKIHVQGWCGVEQKKNIVGAWRWLVPCNGRGSL